MAKERKTVALTGDRECPKCGETKDIMEAFGLRKMRYADGTSYERPQPWCRECRRTAASASRPAPKPRKPKGPSTLQQRADAARKLAESFDSLTNGAVAHDGSKRVCNRCLRHLPLDDFIKDKKGKDGRGRKCKACKAAQSKAAKAAKRAGA